MRAEGSGQLIAELQVVPSPPGTHTDRWAHVDAAIAAVSDSGLVFEVGPLGTTVEGPPDAVWAAIRRAHEATLASGATGIISVVKLYEARDPADQATIADLIAAHRRGDQSR
jgi:uncharacterized protein YqgV (UPF0045/DUF77 family)